LEGEVEIARMSLVDSVHGEVTSLRAWKDDYHTPDDLRDTAVDLFRSAGFSVAVNSPFAGAMVPMEFYRLDKRVLALMIEMRRDLYMDEGTAEKLPGFQKVCVEIRAAIASLLIAFERQFKYDNWYAF
jgi:N-formylglutamate amidohydrolase